MHTPAAATIDTRIGVVTPDRELKARFDGTMGFLRRLARGRTQCHLLISRQRISVSHWRIHS